MSVFHGSVLSQRMEMRTGVTIVFPNELKPEYMPYKVLYLLHGKTDDHHCWSDQTMLPIFVNEYNIFCVIPEVQKSWYEDERYGLPYYSYITEELPAMMRKLLPISDKREDTAVAGNSMGGYGALKCALRRPDQYGLCGSFSSSCAIRRKLVHDDERDYHEMKAILGLDFENAGQADLFPIAEACALSPVKPRIYMAMGYQDPLSSYWQAFRDKLNELSFSVRAENWDGLHDWYFWNECLTKFLKMYYARG